MLFVLLSSFYLSVFRKKSIPISTQKNIKSIPENLQASPVTGNYASANYVNQHMVPSDRFTYYSPGDQSTRSLSLAFDGKGNTFWASSVEVTETTKSYITINFTSLTWLEGIIYGPTFATNKSVTPNTRRYDGYPILLNIYSSSNNEPFELRYCFRSYPSPTDVWDNVQLIFTNPIWCDKIKLEFIDVTFNYFFGNGYYPSCAQIKFMTPAEDYISVTTVQATGNYNNNNYISTNRIPDSLFTAFSPGDKIDHPLSYAFDGSTSTYWVTSTSNTDTFKNYLTFNFDSLTCIEAILYSMAYSTNRSVTPNTRRYDGYPYVLKVFTSINDEPFKLSHIFTGGPTSSDLWEKVQFVFQTPIWCDKLKLEFTELTLDIFFGNDYSVACGQLYLIRATTTPPTPTPAQDPQPEYITVPQIQGTGDYGNLNTIGNIRIPSSSYTVSSAGDKPGRNLSYIYDNNKDSYWVSSNLNNETFKNYITFDFNSKQCIRALVLSGAYSTDRTVNPNTRRYDGYPNILSVYTSSNGDPLKLSHVFNNPPSGTQVWDFTAFMFEDPVCCDKLKVEFTNITLDASFGNDYSVAVGELALMTGIPAATPTRSPTPMATISQSPTASVSMSPMATPTASATPMPTPTPQRTPHGGQIVDDTYINKNFTGSIPVSTSNQIQLGGSNPIKQISGCRFTDLDITNRQFFLKVTGESSIFDNVFERTTYTTGKAGCIWYNVNNGNKFIISNCKFIKITGKDADASVFNANAADLVNIEFLDCEFIDCGEKGDDRPIVNILRAESQIAFNNCFFSYEEPQISRVLEMKGNGATFNNCQFNNCGTKSIDLGIEDVSISTHRVFQFTNNIVNSINTRFINAPRVRAKPIIDNNVFEGGTLTGEIMIYIKHDQDVIEFNNNTFNNIISRSGSTADANRGSLLTFVEGTGSNYKVKYNECHFTNIINEHNDHPNNQGGAFQYFTDESSEVDIEITNCEFKSNKARHHGGAISIRTCGSVTISGCTFEQNEANYVSSSSKLLYENYYDQKTNGFGGAIYLNPTFRMNDENYSMKAVTISGCTFNKNRAYQGYAIYIEGETSSITYSIENNNFNNNYESADSPNKNGIVATEDLILTKEVFEGFTNSFSNTETGTNSEKFVRVDHKGNLLPEGNYSYDDEQFAPSDPNDRIEKVLDESSMSEVSAKVTVTVSEISSKSNQDGGAIHIVNCALDCTGTKFDTCESPTGAGGGIYIKNTGGKENNANLVGLTFNKCKAQYGGAVYIYSDSISNPVTIKLCTFTNNMATSTQSADSSLFGGAAVFLTTKKGDLSSNIFSNNEGDGGALRIYNNFKKNTRNLKNFRLLSNNREEILLISDCSFEIAKSADCCLFYVRGNNGASVELQKCSFTGLLAKGSHYIDGKTIANNGPKLAIKKCKFSYDSSNSLNMKDYLSIDLNDQTFAFDGNPANMKKGLSTTTWMIIAAACVAAAIKIEKENTCFGFTCSIIRCWFRFEFHYSLSLGKVSIIT